MYVDKISIVFFSQNLLSQRVRPDPIVLVENRSETFSPTSQSRRPYFHSHFEAYIFNSIFGTRQTRKSQRTDKRRLFAVEIPRRTNTTATTTTTTSTPKTPPQQHNNGNNKPAITVAEEEASLAVPLGPPSECRYAEEPVAVGRRRGMRPGGDAPGAPGPPGSFANFDPDDLEWFDAFFPV